MLIAAIILTVFFGVAIPQAVRADRAAQLDYQLAVAVAQYWENRRGY